jgi:2'-5' RNA ligase
MASGHDRKFVEGSQGGPDELKGMAARVLRVPTIGVAVAIPEPWATELQDYRMALGDATATMIPTHITLVPPTEVAGDLSEIESHLRSAALTVSEFGVHLRGTGTFRPVSPVVFVSLVEGISQCEQLADAVRRGPLLVDLTFPYHPHVTIAHHLSDAQLDQAFEELASFECEFDVTDFHLYVHDSDRGWQPSRQFPLGAV